MKTNKLLVAFFASLFTNIAYSADDSYITEGLQRGLGDTRPNSVTSTANAIEINAESSNNSASIKIVPITGASNFSILFSTPLNKQTKEGVFYDTNAFTNSSSVTFNLQKAFFTQENLVPDADRLNEFCGKNLSKFGFDKELGEGEKCTDKFKIDVLVKNYEKNKGANEIVDFWKAQLNKPIFLFGMTATAGREEYSYLSGLTEETSTRTPWGAGFNLTYAIPRSMMVTAQYEYQQAYKAQKDVIFCPTTPSANGLLDCIQGANGAPNENKNKLLSLEIRKPFSVANVAIAISPKLIRDIKDNVTKFSMPIYFFQDQKKNLTGGISTNWSNQDHEWKFGVFVGSSFGLF